MACCGNKIKPEVQAKAIVVKITEIIPASKVKVIIKDVRVKH